MDGQSYIAVVVIAGFAIQQVIEICDPLISKGIKLFGSADNISGSPKYIGGLNESDFKKSVTMFLSFVLGLCFISWLLGGEGILSASLEADWQHGWVDFYMTALLIGSGTEGLNTLQKYFGYVKDQKKNSPVTITITPKSVKVVPLESVQFSALVTHTDNQSVLWMVPQSNGGEVDPVTGSYRAPDQAGEFKIVASSRADPTKFATATVTVT